MLSKVVICSISNAPKFAPAEWEEVFKVCCSLRIEAKLFFGVVTKSEIFLFDIEGIEPITAEASPVIEPFKVSTRLAEEFKLHLLKLSYSENEVTWSNFVSERFTNLSNTERNFFTACTLNISKVYEDTLCRFRTKIDFVLAILSNALKSFEHKIELANICEVMLATKWAWNLLFFDVVHHFFVGPACNISAVKVFDEIICSVTSFALTTIHKRV